MSKELSKEEVEANKLLEEIKEPKIQPKSEEEAEDLNKKMAKVLSVKVKSLKTRMGMEVEKHMESMLKGIPGGTRQLTKLQRKHINNSANEVFKTAALAFVDKFSEEFGHIKFRMISNKFFTDLHSNYFMIPKDSEMGSKVQEMFDAYEKEMKEAFPERYQEDSKGAKVEPKEAKD